MTMIAVYVHLGCTIVQYSTSLSQLCPVLLKKGILQQDRADYTFSVLVTSQECSSCVIRGNTGLLGLLQGSTLTLYTSCRQMHTLYFVTGRSILHFSSRLLQAGLAYNQVLSGGSSTLRDKLPRVNSKIYSNERQWEHISFYPSWVLLNHL